MKNERTSTILSLIFNVAVAASSLPALISYFYKTGDANMQVSKFESLRYFTNLSNYLIAFAGIIMAVFCIRKLISPKYEAPQWAFLFKYVATVCTTLTFITCVVFLGPVFGVMWSERFGFWSGYLFLFKGNAFYLHFLSPMIAIIGFLLFDKGLEFTQKQMRLGVIPEVIYSVLYFVMVVAIGSDNGGWTDFYGFTFGGRMYMIPFTVVAMFFGTLLICRIIWKTYSKRRLKDK